MEPRVSAPSCDFMSLEELAERTNISLPVAYELAKKDKLPVPAIRIGRQYRFSRRAYDAVVNGQHADQTADVA